MTSSVAASAGSATWNGLLGLRCILAAQDIMPSTQHDQPAQQANSHCNRVACMARTRCARLTPLRQAKTDVRTDDGNCRASQQSRSSTISPLRTGTCAGRCAMSSKHREPRTNCTITLCKTAERSVAQRGTNDCRMSLMHQASAGSHFAAVYPPSRTARPDWPCAGR